MSMSFGGGGSSSSGGGNAPETTVYTASAGQTAFALSHTPATDTSGDELVTMHVGSLMMTLGDDFSVAGQTLTYLGGVALGAGEKVTITVWPA